MRRINLTGSFPRVSALKSLITSLLHHLSSFIIHSSACTAAAPRFAALSVSHASPGVSFVQLDVEAVPGIVDVEKLPSFQFYRGGRLMGEVVGFAEGKIGTSGSKARMGTGWCTSLLS